MTRTSTQSIKGMAKKEATLVKIFKAIKKFISKEFLWILFVLLLALPLTLMTHYFIKKYIYEDAVELVAMISDEISLFTANLILNVTGIYLTRAVAGALKTINLSPKS